MEPGEKYKYKLKIYEDALKGFESSLNIDTTSFSKEVVDAIKNGRIQKFEYFTELTWKIIKNFLFIFHNIDASSPRDSVKSFFLIKAVNDSDYGCLLICLMIEIC